MRADGYPQEAWERLGRLLEERRGELNPDWANRAQFLRDTGMNKKLIERLELARMDSYRPATLAKVSVAYGWTADSVRRILSGGEPQARAEGTTGEPVLAAADDFERHVLASALPYPEKRAAIYRHREQARAQLAELGLDEDSIIVPPSLARALRRSAGLPDGDAGHQARGA